MVADNDLIATLASILAEDRVLTDDASVCLYAQDVYSRDLPALAVIRPLSVEELSAAVRAVHTFWQWQENRTEYPRRS